MATAKSVPSRRIDQNHRSAAGVRVLHFISEPRSWQFFEGQPGYLRAHGIELHAASSPGPLLEEFGRVNSIPVHAVPVERRLAVFSDVVSVWRLFRILRDVRPDILHAHFSKPGIIGMVAGALARTPIRIYHNHGMALSSARGWKAAILWVVEWLSCLLAHRVIYVAPSVLADAEKLGVCGPGHGCVILSANGLDCTKRFTRNLYGAEYRDRWHRSLQIPEDAFVVGFVGRLFKIKGIDDLVRAWQSLAPAEPRLHLLLVGQSDARLPISTWAERAISSESRIHLTGFLEEPASIYPAMDLVVLPSYHEGLGYSLIEGAAMELPVIGTRIPGIVDAVLEGVNGVLVEPGRPDQLAAAILKYLRNPGLAEVHGKAGRQFAVSRFQRTAVWDGILQTYDQLLRARFDLDSG
jgi:glycosyltransferase involved in cell wall biosynthesis